MSKDPYDTPTVEGSFRILPSDIDATKPFYSAFGQAEVEHVALGVVLYCQAQGGWVSFTKDELTTFFRDARAAGKTFPYTYVPMGWNVTLGPKKTMRDAYSLFMSDRDAPVWTGGEPDAFKFYWLSPEIGRLVRLGGDGRYRVTELFITSCHESSPARKD